MRGQTICQRHRCEQIAEWTVTWSEDGSAIHTAAQCDQHARALVDVALELGFDVAAQLLE